MYVPLSVSGSNNIVGVNNAGNAFFIPGNNQWIRRIPAAAIAGAGTTTIWPYPANPMDTISVFDVVHAAFWDASGKVITDHFLWTDAGTLESWIDDYTQVRDARLEKEKQERYEKRGRLLQYISAIFAVLAFLTALIK